jgi:N6-adenosine-specific RNA methylase IME4
VFLWTLDRFLLESEHEMVARQFHRHARLIWDKGQGTGPRTPTVRIEHEYLVWYTRGGLLPIADGTRWRWSTVLRERTRQHSRKPEAAYQMVEAFYPDARKLDAFSRAYRVGWDAYGDQVDHFTPLLAPLREVQS